MAKIRMIPTVGELLGEYDAIPCVALRHVFKRLEAEGIFAPWVELGKDGEVSKLAARKLFMSWYEADPRAIEMMAQPKVEGKPIHSAARSLGGATLFGGEEGNFDEAAGLFPPIIFGHKCVVRRGASLGGPCIFGDGVRVGSSHISRTVVFHGGTKIAAKVVMGDSIVGAGCKIESGVSVRSQSIARRATDGTILTRAFAADGRIADIRTHRKVLGVIIGWGCTVEASLEPGTVLMPQCHVRPWMSLPAGIYTPQILDGLHRQWELRMLSDIRGVVTPVDPES